MPSVFVGIQVIMAVSMPIDVLWLVTLGSLVEASHSFRQTYCLHFQGRIVIYFENGSSRLFQNVGKFLPDHTASHNIVTILHTKCQSNVVSVHGIKSYRGNGGTAPLILNPCTR